MRVCRGDEAASDLGRERLERREDEEEKGEKKEKKAGEGRRDSGDDGDIAGGWMERLDWFRAMWCVSTSGDVDVHYSWTSQGVCQAAHRGVCIYDNTKRAEPHRLLVTYNYVWRHSIIIHLHSKMTVPRSDRMAQTGIIYEIYICMMIITMIMTRMYF